MLDAYLTVLIMKPEARKKSQKGEVEGKTLLSSRTWNDAKLRPGPNEPSARTSGKLLNENKLDV